MAVCAPGSAGRIMATRSHIGLDVSLGQSSASLSFSFLTCKTATVILSCHCVLVNDGVLILIVLISAVAEVLEIYSKLQQRWLLCAVPHDDPEHV